MSSEPGVEPLREPETGGAGAQEIPESRLHPSAMIFEAIRTVRSWVSAALIPGLAALFGSGLSAWAISLILTLAALLVIFSVVWGFLSWRATSYGVAGGVFFLKRGVLQKNERTIPLDHIQSVDTVQGFVQRLLQATGLLDVVEVRIETAGGSASETDASLAALTRPAAVGLRREIRRIRSLEGGPEPGTPNAEPEGPEVIRTLPTRDLLIAGATSGQIGAAAAIVAFASQFFDNFVNRFLSGPVVEGIVQTVAPYAFAVLLLAVFAIGLFAWLLAIVGTVLAYAGFTLSRSPDGKYLYIKRGLLRRYEATLPVARIQAVRTVEGVLRQPFGLAMVRVESAGYGEQAGSAGASTLFPLMLRREVPDLLARTLPEFAVEADLRPLPRRALRRYILRATFPALFIVPVAAASLFFTGLLESLLVYAVPGAVALFVALALYGWAEFRAAGWALRDGCFVSRERNLARTTSVAPRRRLQSRSVVVSPLQRRLDLATLRTRVASGSGGATFEVVDLDVWSAKTLLSDLGPGIRAGGGVPARSR